MLMPLLLISLNIFFREKYILIVQIIALLIYLFPLRIKLSLLQQTSLPQDLLCDEFSLFMILLTLILFWLMQRFYAENKFSWPVLQLRLVTLLASCLLLFIFNRMFIFYISYEFSLFPIIFIIIKWGKYRNRYLRAIFLLLYTSLLAIPFLFVLIRVWKRNITFIFTLTDLLSLNKIIDSFYCRFILIVFAVKLPVYGLHFWLPIAHVEAPTFGSIILAGVLLKLGIIGIVRFRILFQKGILFIWEGYFILAIFISTALCCFQNDFKVMIAYSSISHIRAIPLLILCYRKLSFRLMLTISVFHGFSSILFFILVGVLYKVYGTRNLIFIGGIMWLLPSLSFIRIIGIIAALPIPPFPSFIREVLIFSLLTLISKVNIFVLFTFSVFSLLYNLQWFSLIFLSKTQKNLNYIKFSYSLVRVLTIIILVYVPFFLCLKFIF